MNSQLLEQLSSVERLTALMEDLGLKKYLTPSVLTAALELYEGRLPRAELQNQAKSFFVKRAAMVPKGLEDLPAIWLSRLPEILRSTRKPKWKVLPYFIGAFGNERGILRIGFGQEQQIAGRISKWDQLRVVANVSLYPSIWQPLSLEDEKAIWNKRPDLRKELLWIG